MDKILSLLENDAKLTPEQLAVMLGKETGDIKRAIEEYEREGVILGYQALVDWDKTDREYVTALIEVKITPQPDLGFDKAAEKIYSYPEVKACILCRAGSTSLSLSKAKQCVKSHFLSRRSLLPSNT